MAATPSMKPRRWRQHRPSGREAEEATATKEGGGGRSGDAGMAATLSMEPRRWCNTRLPTACHEAEEEAAAEEVEGGGGGGKGQLGVAGPYGPDGLHQTRLESFALLSRTRRQANLSPLLSHTRANAAAAKRNDTIHLSRCQPGDGAALSLLSSPLLSPLHYCVIGSSLVLVLCFKPPRTALPSPPLFSSRTPRWARR